MFYSTQCKNQINICEYIKIFRRNWYVIVIVIVYNYNFVIVNIFIKNQLFRNDSEIAANNMILD